MNGRQDTIAAIATPSGSGAIGIVRLSGPDSLTIARRISRTQPQPRHAHFCTFLDQDNRVIDNGILLYFPAPNSFTGEDVIELQGHGGPIVLNMLLKQMLQYGARPARPGEFSERAYLNGRIDLLQAEAIADLINSASERAARSAARSLEGEFSETVNRIVEDMIALRVYIEGALDFPEEEIDFLAGQDINARLDALLHRLEELLARAEAGRRLGSGLRVAIIGRPNVGKSSLLNRLLQVDRAIVTEIAGTTRDTIEDTVLIEGTPVTIVDTAGIREPADPVEREGIRRSRDQAARADVILLMTDSRDVDISGVWVDVPAAGGTPIIVHNKIDRHDLPASLQTIDGQEHVFLSAKTGAGLDLLKQRLAERAGTADAGEDVILARQRHTDALRSAAAQVRSGLDAFRQARSAELLAEELRKAQESLGSITGGFHNDELLGEIFSRFCIGK